MRADSQSESSPSERTTNRVTKQLIDINPRPTKAAACVSVFALSTFETDYLLVKSSTLDRALDALRDDGVIVNIAT